MGKITPGSFDPETAREVVGEELANKIEAKARADADSLIYDPPTSGGLGDSWWSQCQKEFRSIVYREQFNKRHTRNLRKQASSQPINKEEK